MRDAFAKELVELGKRDPRIVLLMGDIGNRLFNPFREQFADRFYNCGVAEANMMSVAAGMGLCGLRPFVYTIVPFVTTRCLEQIRVDVCYHRSPVTIVGVGGGLSYAGLGATHHACDDVAFLRQLPGISIACPADPKEVRSAMQAVLANDGPAYIRLGKKGEPNVPGLQATKELGKATVIRDGNDLAIISTGHVLPVVLRVAEKLEQHSVRARVVHMPWVKPLDGNMLQELARTFPLLVTVEEHSIVGGLGSSIAEWLCDAGLNQTRLVRFGTPDEFLHLGGSEEHLRRICRLDEGSLVERIVAASVQRAATS